MTTEERLENLERELGRAKKRSRWLLVGLALGLGVLALVWASAASAPRAEAQGAAGGRTIRASEFVLEDEKGKVRAVLGVIKDAPGLGRFYGPVLSLFDENGELCVVLHGTAGGPGLRLFDAAGKERATLGVGKDGPALRLNDENKMGGAGLGALKDGPMLNLFDAAGKVRAGLTLPKDGPGLNLFDAEGKNRAALTVDKDGGPGLSLFDENGKSRAWLTLPKDGPGLTLFDAAGKGRATLGAGQIVLPDGRIVSYTESSMRLFGPDGNMTWQAPWSAP